MLLSYEEELRLTTKLLSASGLPESDAETVARVVTHSDFTGVYSHGLSRLTAYLSQLSIGSLNPRPAIRKITDTGAVMAFDCDNGSGVLAVNRKSQREHRLWGILRLARSRRQTDLPAVCKHVCMYGTVWRFRQDYRHKPNCYLRAGR